MTALTLNTSAQAGVDSAHSAQEPKTSLDWLQAGHTAVITGGANGIGRICTHIKIDLKS